MKGPWLRSVSRGRMKRLVAGAATLGAAGTALAGLLTAAATSWPLEVVCHFQVQILVTALGCAVALGALRRWTWMAVALAGAFSAAAAVFPYESPGAVAHAQGVADGG